VVNLIIGLVVIRVAGSGESNVVFGVGAAILAAIGLGLGVVLLLLRKPWAKGLGMGLMIGWALASIVSAGWCTGLNPELYI
jgi:hypothetical protein